MVYRLTHDAVMVLVGAGAWVIVAGTIITVPPVVKLALSAVRKLTSE